MLFVEDLQNSVFLKLKAKDFEIGVCGRLAITDVFLGNKFVESEIFCASTIYNSRIC